MLHPTGGAVSVNTLSRPSSSPTGGRHEPLDLVFIDADKDWYTNYAKAVIPRLRVGGCLAAHNVYARGGERRGIGGEYDEYVTSLPYLETTVTPGGLSVSYKRRDK